MIFQDPMTSLNPVTTIGKQMIDIQYREPGSRAEKRARAIEFLEQVQLPDAAAKLDVYPHQLSGGMRQRVCIAMALLTRPDLLIADELTTALDATLEMQIVTLLRELQEKFGCSVLFVSHHLGTVAELRDEVVVMYAGEVVEHGDVGQVFHTPRHPYTQALFDCDPARIRQATRQGRLTAALSGEPRARSGGPPRACGTVRRGAEPGGPTEGCDFHPRCPWARETCATRDPGWTVEKGRGHRCLFPL